MALLAIRINAKHFSDPGGLMSRFSGTVFAFFLLTAALAGSAFAEKTLPVNDSNTGVFDQPSVTMNGAAAHIAYIGDNTGSSTYRVFYAAVNAGADFSNVALSRDNTVLLTFPTAVDNATAPNEPYYDARHPRIALRSATEAVILFQAKPTSLDNVYRPYIARLTLAGYSVTSVSVRQVQGFPSGTLASGDIEDIDFRIVTTDNTARVAFGARSAISTAIPFEVYFARVGLDNATVVGTPLQLTGVSGSQGFRPIPRLALDSLARAHIAWAANDNSLGPNPIYYAMVKETSGADSLAIAATQVIGGSVRWGHPNLLLFNNSSIVILAADESVPGIAGSLGLVNINPEADNQDGTPVQIATDRLFFLTPPGEAILDGEYRVYRPDAFLDTLGRIHVTGYGSGGRCTYYAFRLITTPPYAEFVTTRIQVGFDSPELPGVISGDYTKAALGFFTSGKAIVFWSGLVPGGTNRNLDFTGIPTVTAFPSDESGCSMVADPRAGERARIPGTALLFLPAIILAVRRILAGGRLTRRRAFAK